MAKKTKVSVFIFDLWHLFDRLEGLELELDEVNRLIGQYLEIRLSKSGYLVVHPTHDFMVRTNPYFRYIEDKLDKCRLTGLFDPTMIPTHQRAVECHFVVREYNLIVVFP